MKYYFTGIQILFFTALLIFSSCNLSDNVDEFNNSRIINYSNFVGSQKCKECHKKEYGGWMGSHHQLAMQKTDSTSVVGDFNSAFFSNKGINYHFFQKR